MQGPPEHSIQRILFSRLQYHQSVITHGWYRTLMEGWGIADAHLPEFLRVHIRSSLLQGRPPLPASHGGPYLSSRGEARGRVSSSFGHLTRKCEHVFCSCSYIEVSTQDMSKGDRLVEWPVIQFISTKRRPVDWVVPATCWDSVRTHPRMSQWKCLQLSISTTLPHNINKICFLSI